MSSSSSSASATAAPSVAGPKITLYFDPISQPSRAVQMLLRECHLDHEVKLVSLEDRAQLAPEFLAINPMHKLPTIVEAAVPGGAAEFVTDESMTIMRYLVSSRGLPRHWYPADLRLQARVNQYLDWHHINLRRPAGLTAFMSLFGVRAGVPEETVRATIAELAQPLRNAMNHLESRLQKQDWIASAENISIADLSCVTEVAQLSILPYDLAPYPRVSAWYDRVRHRVKSFDAVHETVTAYRERVAKAGRLSSVIYLDRSRNILASLGVKRVVAASPVAVAAAAAATGGNVVAASSSSDSAAAASSSPAASTAAVPSTIPIRDVDGDSSGDDNDDLDVAVPTGPLPIIPWKVNQNVGRAAPSHALPPSAAAPPKHPGSARASMRSETTAVARAEEAQGQQTQQASKRPQSAHSSAPKRATAPVLSSGGGVSGGPVSVPSAVPKREALSASSVKSIDYGSELKIVEAANAAAAAAVAAAASAPSAAEAAGGQSAEALARDTRIAAFKDDAPPSAHVLHSGELQVLEALLDKSDARSKAARIPAAGPGVESAAAVAAFAAASQAAASAATAARRITLEADRELRPVIPASSANPKDFVTV